MKKTAFVLLSLLLCFTVAFGASAQQATITVDGVEVNQVDVNGNPVPDPGDKYLVPLRAVLNAMGLPVFYDEGTGIVTGVRRTDPDICIVPGDEYSVLIDGTTFVIMNALDGIFTGYHCDYDIANNIIAYENTRYEPEDGYYRIWDQSSGEYLTADPLPDSDIVENMTDEDGSIEEVVKTPAQQIMASQVYLAEANDSDNQLWLIRKKAGKNYTIINKNTGLALDMNNWSVDNGGNLIQYTLAGGTNQQWNFFSWYITDHSYKGFFNIRNVNSQLDLGTVDYVSRRVDEYESDLDENAVIQYSSDYCRQFPHWGLELVEPYVNPVDLAIETGAFDEAMNNTMSDKLTTDHEIVKGIG